MRCKKHTADPSSTVGVCATCLRDRLSALILAQAHAQAHAHISKPRASDPLPPSAPPLLFPRSVSPYVSRRKSDESTNPSTWSQTHIRFYSTPQVGPTSTSTFTTPESFPKKNKKFSLFANLFRSRSGKFNPDPSPSWLPNFRRKKHPTTIDFPGRRNIKPSDRGMSPVRGEAGCEEFDRSPETWTKSPATRRGKHGRNVSGMAFCLSPLVRASPNRQWNSKSEASEVNLKPHLSTAASFCANRSRKLADFGRLNPNR